MSESPMSHDDIIRRLGDAIEAEVQKPFEEVDTDFVNECGNLLDELMDPAHVLPEEEEQERLIALYRKIKRREAEKEKRVIRKRHLVRALIAAVVAACLSITVFSMVPLQEAYQHFRNMDVWDFLSYYGIKYTYRDDKTKYENMDTLIAKEELDILSFQYLSNDIWVTNVNQSHLGMFIDVFFNVQNTMVVIMPHVDILSEHIPYAEVISYPKLTGYLFSVQNEAGTKYTLAFYHNNKIYHIVSTSEFNVRVIFEALASEA